MALLRIKACQAAVGWPSRASVYSAIRSGTWTPPVKTGPRTSAWPEGEVRALVAARIAGHTDEQLRELVKRLVEKRAELA
jgi:prophage regulatory protein